MSLTLKVTSSNWLIDSLIKITHADWEAVPLITKCVKYSRVSLYSMIHTVWTILYGPYWISYAEYCRKVYCILQVWLLWSIKWMVVKIAWMLVDHIPLPICKIDPCHMIHKIKFIWNKITPGHKVRTESRKGHVAYQQMGRIHFVWLGLTCHVQSDFVQSVVYAENELLFLIKRFQSAKRTWLSISWRIWSAVVGFIFEGCE